MSTETQKLILFNEWTDEYNKRRYLEHASAEELHRRAEDLVENIITIGALGEAIVYQGEDFRRLLGHVYAEFGLRNMPIPSEVKQQPYKHHTQAARLWTSLGLRQGSYLLKFGNSEYMVPMLQTGRIRVSNAKRFDTLLLNEAIRDCEVKFEEECYGMQVELPSNSRHNQTGKSLPLPTIGNVRRIASCDTDYYIACFGLKYDLRLFDDFSRGSEKPYDACLVITKPLEFINQMRECGERRLPGWDFAALPITYRDPYDPSPESLDIFFIKHFRYAYQKEFRLAWTPPKPKEKLESVEFVLGPLKDYCKLLVL
jgi:hypothetical protein